MKDLGSNPAALTSSGLDVSTLLVKYVTRLMTLAISYVGEDNCIFFNTLFAKISSDSSFGNCLALNDNATLSLPDDNPK